MILIRPTNAKVKNLKISTINQKFNKNLPCFKNVTGHVKPVMDCLIMIALPV